MRESWLELVDSAVLRPARPDFSRCARERDAHMAQRCGAAERRAQGLADCQRRIELVRADVLAANDGVVSAQMTTLEREWRMLSRTDAEGVMDRWARIAPRTWHDRKRWQGSDAAHRLDAAVALAADVEGVEAAESAVDALRTALVPWHTNVAPRVRWRAVAAECESTEQVLSEPLRAARAVPSDRVLERAEQVEKEVLAAAQARFPQRPILARDIAHAAFVDSVWQAVPLAEAPNPAAALRRLWLAGYALAAVDAAWVTLELPAPATPQAQAFACASLA